MNARTLPGAGSTRPPPDPLPPDQARMALHLVALPLFVLGALLASAASVLPACVTTRSSRRESALVLATDSVEVREVEGGGLALVRVSSDTGSVELGTGHVRLRWRLRAWPALSAPGEQPAGVIVVDGWSDTGCMRVSQACGAQPEPIPAYKALRVRIALPGR